MDDVAGTTGRTDVSRLRIGVDAEQQPPAHLPWFESVRLRGEGPCSPLGSSLSSAAECFLEMFDGVAASAEEDSFVG